MVLDERADAVGAPAWAGNTSTRDADGRMYENPVVQ
jgi:hypothetical protein